MIKFFTNLPLSKREGYVYNSILIIINKNAKITKYLSINKIITTMKLIELFFDNIILRYKIPRRIIINRGSIFIYEF